MPSHTDVIHSAMSSSSMVTEKSMENPVNGVSSNPSSGDSAMHIDSPVTQSQTNKSPSASSSLSSFPSTGVVASSTGSDASGSVESNSISSHASMSDTASSSSSSVSSTLSSMLSVSSSTAASSSSSSAASSDSSSVSSSSSSSSSSTSSASVADVKIRIIKKLTVELMNTYNGINEKYYRRKRQMEQNKLLNKGVNNDGHDDKDYNYVVQASEKLKDRYIVDHSIGKGSFGRVVKAFDTIDNRYVAVKIVKSKSAFYKQAQIEIKILSSLQADADRWNIVSMIDTFMHKNHQCIVFELLSLNLYELLRNTKFQGVSLKLIAKFGHQLLCTLGYLSSTDRKDKRVIHCDLKPENILLRNCRKSAIKVIDLGSACFANQRTYTYIQSRFYRAPEVLLNLPYNGAIDMWSLGCILVEMHTGKPLFDGLDESDQILKQYEVLGLPPVHMLQNNRKAERYFEEDPAATNQWRLRSKFKPIRTSLRQAMASKWQDIPLYTQFEDLISQMLNYDPKLRIRPAGALQHPFFHIITQLSAPSADSSSPSESNSSTSAASSSTSSLTTSGSTASGGSIQAWEMPPGQPLDSSASVAPALGTSSDEPDSTSQDMAISSTTKPFPSTNDDDVPNPNPRKRPHSNPLPANNLTVPPSPTSNQPS